MGSLRHRFSWVFGLAVLSMLIMSVGCSDSKSEELASPTSPASSSATSTPIGSDSLPSSSPPAAVQSDESVESEEASAMPSAPTPDEIPAQSTGSGPEASVHPQSPATSPNTDQADTNKREEIEQKYESRFSSIRFSCQAKLSNLTSEVTSYIAGAKANNGNVSISDLQKKFLGKVAAAEGGCDQRFNSTLAQAEKAYQDAGIEETKIAAWKSQYESGKSKARMTAMSKILAAWQAE